MWENGAPNLTTDIFSFHLASADHIGAIEKNRVLLTLQLKLGQITDHLFMLRLDVQQRFD